MSYKEGLKSFAYTAAFPYAVNTMTRLIGKALDNNKAPDLVSGVSMSQATGIIAGCTTYGLALMGAVVAFKEGHPSYLGIPVVTNAVSFLYEKARDESIRRKSRLEEVVEVQDPEALSELPDFQPRVVAVRVQTRDAIPGLASHLD